MRIKIYNFLVNRHIGIKERYHKFHDGSVGTKKYFSWIYLLLLNFCYYFLFCRFLDKKIGMEIYEEKKMCVDCSESEIFRKESKLSVASMVEYLAKFDVISFDIFDTLIFRPFSEPTDLFYLLGEQLEILDFKRIRMEMEHRARIQKYESSHSYEVTLSDIWEFIEKETGIYAKGGMDLEMDLEMQMCYANPFMLEVYKNLKKMGKRVIAISDMYLPEEFLKKMLVTKGYEGLEEVFVSCEYDLNKGSGQLFQYVVDKLQLPVSRVHVGDNLQSDVDQAKKHGFSSFHYPNINKTGEKYRSNDMSPITGGAYRGVINQRLFNGLETFSQEYEYGFVYGGLFVVGYCAYIHDYCIKNDIDKVLFLSRDGDTLKQVYDRMYPDDQTEYVYWSRRAATKLMACCDKYDFYRRFLHHKVNQKISLKNILASMELEWLFESCPKEWENKYLTDKNVEEVKAFLEESWDEIMSFYNEEHLAAKMYFETVLGKSKKVVAVDIGWAGSGAVAIRTLFRKVWRIPCDVVGLVAGTNTIHNCEQDASETFLQAGKMSAYLYSLSHNRDLMKKHDPNKNYNVYWELLLSSPTPQFKGFGFDESKKQVQLKFGDYEENLDGIREIQKGILDFAEEYQKHFGKFPYMFQISGRDAYAPMLLAASFEEKYLREIEKKFNLQINVS